MGALADGRRATASRSTFLDVHVPAHLAFYRAGIAAITDEDAYAGLLVSMHGAGIYRQRYGADPALALTRAPEVQELVDAFVAEQEAGFPARMAEVGVDDELRLADYHRLQWFDRFSLAFCLREWDDAGGAVRGRLVPLRARRAVAQRASRRGRSPGRRSSAPSSAASSRSASGARRSSARRSSGCPAERVTIGFVE